MPCLNSRRRRQGVEPGLAECLDEKGKHHCADYAGAQRSGPRCRGQSDLGIYRHGQTLPPLTIQYLEFCHQHTQTRIMSSSKLNSEGVLLFEQPFARVISTGQFRCDNTDGAEHRCLMRTTARCSGRHRRQLRRRWAPCRMPPMTCLNAIPNPTTLSRQSRA